MLQKRALLSPAINAQQQQPSPEALTASFEQQFGQMAYEAFSGKFPDLVNSIVTFKILDSDTDNNVATGAFILENQGQFVYVPTVLSDNMLKPFDIMYVKGKDIFLPMTREWIDEVGKVGLSSMGEGTKLPKTVATDVDIRNIVVPPTTGRYSYASADITPHNRMLAEASQPLGMRLTKAAAEGALTQFNPEMWAAFTEQFTRLQQMSPGQALDNGVMDLDTLAKMYKSHLKTWEMGSEGAAPSQGMPPEAAPGAPMPAGYAPVGSTGAMSVQGAAPGMAPLPKMASAGRVNDNGRAMLKHAMQPTEHALKLPEFLQRAPNGVKVGFAKILDKNPSLLRKAASIYGRDVLLNALTPAKTAGTVTRSGGLYIADDKTTAPELSASFGSAAPEAFNGVLLRGYYFKDTRPKLNLAVQVQPYHDFHEAQEPGIYHIYNTKGQPKPALVFVEPLDLLENPRNVFPHTEKRVKRVHNNVQNKSVTLEPGNEPIWALDAPTPDVERSHKINRLVVFPNGDYLRSSKVMGEQVTEVAIPKGPLYSRLMRDGTAAPSKGLGMFAHKRGAHYLGTCPVEITELSTGSDGVTRGKISHPGGFDAKAFVMDPRSPISRPKLLRDTDLVIIPATWKWMPLNEMLDSSDFLMTAQGISSIVLDALGSMGAKEIVARRAGQSMYAVNGGPTLEKKAALHKIAAEYSIHASAAEAMLKIAEIEHICKAHVVAPRAYSALTERVKIAQGEAVPMTPMGAPPAMAAPAPAAPSPVDQAFQETAESMQQQIQQLQGQLNVLMTVQQRAQQIESEQQGGVPMQGMQPGMDPSMQQGMQPGMQPGMDPSLQQGMQQGMQPGMQPGMDPSMQQGMQPQQNAAIMPSEGPSSSEVASQVNPAFLDASAQFQDAGAFDAGAIASLAQDPSIKRLGSEYAADLENSVDDLGRTLLTLYMQEADLKEQMGDKAFVDLERQLRDTFRGLGSLVLALSKNTAMMPEHAAA